MKKFALPALAATLALSLAACGETETPATDDATVVEETVVPAPAETTVVTEGDGTTDGDSMTISEDGVQADIGDGDTRVNADVDGDPSLTVESD